MNQAIFRKSQELSFALLRVAGHIRRFELRRTIERLSYHLLENISYQNPEMSLSTIDALRNFVVLGKNIYEVETVNAKILERELEHLSNMVKEQLGLSTLPDLETMFTKDIQVRREAQKKPQPKAEPVEVLIDEAEVEAAIKEYGNEEIPEMRKEERGNEERKAKIIEAISSSNDKKLNFGDIANLFPEVSDRTIRYDLHSLVSEGRVVRQGSGGPGNFYTL